MKKKLVLTLFLGFLLVAGNSFADYIPIMVGDKVVVNENPAWPRGTNGGPFEVTIVGKDFSFGTFCIETDEYLNLGGTYIVDSISRTVVGGGSNVPPGSPELSYGAAYLYDQWLNDSRKDQQAYNDAYQQAIWYFEGENSNLTTAQKLLLGSIWDEANQANSKTGYLGVYALNLVDSFGNLKQSLLVKDPVPEPVSMLLFGTGLVAAGGYVRRKMKK